MRSTVILVACAALAGCGSFPLGTSYPQKGQTQHEVDADILYCKDWSKTATDTDARIAGSFLAGLTIIGAPIAIKSARDRHRELFSECMSARGYKVVGPA